MTSVKLQAAKTVKSLCYAEGISSVAVIYNFNDDMDAAIYHYANEQVALSAIRFAAKALKKECDAENEKKALTVIVAI